ncbi:MAG: NlpC/P60 family protein [Sulfurimonas sp.]|nr:NlpC/P60 family protein [Sulfurimonas sp.]
MESFSQLPSSKQTPNSMTKSLLFVVLSLFLLSGCSSKKLLQTQDFTKPINSTKTLNITETKKAIPEYKPSQNNWITIALYEEYKKWYRTPYEYGGFDTSGLDCSSLIQNIYKDAFNIDLPRTTKDQVQKGYLVSRTSVKEGDLVFFKTGYKQRHAGIIIEKDKFIHTSSKRGVSISSLNNPYWRDKYWQTRRILP